MKFQGKNTVSVAVSANADVCNVLTPSVLRGGGGVNVSLTTTYSASFLAFFVYHISRIGKVPGTVFHFRPSESTLQNNNAPSDRRMERCKHTMSLPSEGNVSSNLQRRFLPKGLSLQTYNAISDHRKK
jgi:hypothetical protein